MSPINLSSLCCFSLTTNTYAAQNCSFRIPVRFLPASMKKAWIIRSMPLKKVPSTPLKLDFHGKLHVKGFSRTDSRSAVEIADGIAYQAEARAGGADTPEQQRRSRIGGPATAAHRAWSGSEIHAIEEVEHLRPELHGKPLPHRDIFEHGQVHISVTGAVELVAAGIAGGPGGRSSEGGGVPPLQPALGSGKRMIHSTERIANHIQAEPGHVRGLAGVEVHQAADLPAMGQDARSARPARNVIRQRRGE